MMVFSVMLLIVLPNFYHTHLELYSPPPCELFSNMNLYLTLNIILLEIYIPKIYKYLTNSPYVDI